MKKEPNQTMTQYIENFVDKAEQLDEAGLKVPQEMLSIMLLNALPIEYENFCVAIESRDDIPNLESLKSKLLEQEARQEDRSVKEARNERVNNALFVKNKKKSNENMHANSRC
jgi:hypothetical protein